MSAFTSMSVFRQWLRADPAGKASACAIILHCADSLPCGPLIQDIADYLNEYDDDCDGRWLPATPELVEKISRDANHRRLLAIAEFDSAAPDDDPQTRYRQTLTGLGQRGHVIVCAPAGDFALANTFHAGVGPSQQIPGKCHLFLNSELMDQKCIAHIIGDVFLEWLHCDLRRSIPLHEIR